MLIERKTIATHNVEFKTSAREGSPGRVRLYFSTYDWDNVRPIPERTVPGAFKQYLPKLIKKGFSSFNHKLEGLPDATIEEAGEDDRGAWAELEYHSHQAARDAYTVAKERYERGHDVSASFAYRTHDSGLVDMDDPGLKAKGIDKGRELRLLEVLELPVNIPANSLAVATSVKSLLPPNMTFAEQLDATLDIVLDTKERAYEVQELRTKEGRAINADRRARLAAIRDALATLATVKDELDTLLQETEPAPKETDQPKETPKSLPEDDADVEMAQLYARFYARKAGVTIP